MISIFDQDKFGCDSVRLQMIKQPHGLLGRHSCIKLAMEHEKRRGARGHITYRTGFCKDRIAIVESSKNFHSVKEKCFCKRWGKIGYSTYINDCLNLTGIV